MIEEIRSQMTSNFIRLKTNKRNKTKTTTHQSVHEGPLMSSVVAMWKREVLFSCKRSVVSSLVITQPGPVCVCVCVSHLGLMFLCGN